MERYTRMTFFMLIKKKKKKGFQVLLGCIFTLKMAWLNEKLAYSLFKNRNDVPVRYSKSLPGGWANRGSAVCTQVPASVECYVYKTY